MAVPDRRSHPRQLRVQLHFRVRARRVRSNPFCSVHDDRLPVLVRFRRAPAASPQACRWAPLITKVMFPVVVLPVSVRHLRPMPSACPAAGCLAIRGLFSAAWLLIPAVSRCSFCLPWGWWLYHAMCVFTRSQQAVSGFPHAIIDPIRDERPGICSTPCTASSTYTGNCVTRRSQPDSSVDHRAPRQLVTALAGGYSCESGMGDVL